MKAINHNRLYRQLAVIKKTFKGKAERISYNELTAIQHRALRESAHYMRVWLDKRAIPHPAPTPTCAKQIQDLAIPFANSENFCKRTKAFVREVTRRAKEEAEEHFRRYGVGYASYFRERYHYWYQALKEEFGI